MRNVIAWLLGIIICLQLPAQSDQVDRVLSQIAQNNLSLKALHKKIEAESLQLRSQNNLEDPLLNGYYLPFGNDPGGEYTEYEISQRFEFPGVYIARKKRIEKEIRQLELEELRARQEVLLEAKQHCLELIILEKHINKERQRRARAERVYQMMQEQFSLGQISILELNKAKISWMEEKFTVQEMETEKRTLLLHLKALNGGIDPAYNVIYFEEELNLAEADSIWQEKLKHSPQLLQLTMREEASQHQLSVSRNQSLPNLTAGYNYQGFPSANVSGFYGGITIPLWKNRHKQKSAKIMAEQAVDQADARRLMEFALLQEDLDHFRTLRKAYEEFHETIHELESEEMLKEALEAGEISFIEYYLELQFYRESHEAMLHMEKELRMHKAEILKHQL